MKSRITNGCLFVLLIFSLIGCGGTGQAEGTNAPDILHVVRNSVPGYHIASLNLVIHDVAQVQNLYKAAYALQQASGASNCAFDNGLKYHLDFLHGAISVQQMELHATGCQILDLNATGYDFLGIITTHDRRFTTPSFRTMLAKILNLSSLSPPNY